MRILVIEDKEMHRKSAQETLTRHDVTIAKSFDEAMELMSERIDEKNVQRLLTEEGFPTEPDWKNDHEQYVAYSKVRHEAQEKSIIPFSFEVVLTDMMMPEDTDSHAIKIRNSKTQVPYGFVIALKATLCGAKYVAMVTDTNHHKSTMSAALDYLGGGYYEDGFKPNFVINGAKVMFVHAPFLEDILKDVPCDWCEERPGVCSTCNGSGRDKHRGSECVMCREDIGKCEQCKGTTRFDKQVYERKDWGKVLADLIS